VVLPDHLHAVWTMPEGDADFATRWRLIKTGFSRRREALISDKQYVFASPLGDQPMNRKVIATALRGTKDKGKIKTPRGSGQTQRSWLSPGSALMGRSGHQMADKPAEPVENDPTERRHSNYGLQLVCAKRWPRLQLWMGRI
jgi:hypothetical protein